MRRCAGVLQRSFALSSGARGAASELGVVSGAPEDTYNRKACSHTVGL